MIDLNSAGPDLIAEAGLDPAAIQALQLWRPFRSWMHLLSVDEIDDAAIASLKARGFGTRAPEDAQWALPPVFAVSSDSGPRATAS